MEEHQKLLMGGGNASASEGGNYMQYKSLMIRFVKVLLQIISEKRYRGLLAEFIKKKYVPIEESYILIQEAKQGHIDRQNSGSPRKKSQSANKPVRDREINESLAILLKRQGDNEKAVDLYIQVLIDISQAEVVSALYISNGEVPFEDSVACNGNAHILKFDALVVDIVRICDKTGGTEDQQEALWLHAIRQLYKVKQSVFDDGSNK